MNKRILLTGITGFIGMNLAAQLINENFSVYALVRQESHFQNLSPLLRDKVTFIYIDQKESLVEILKNIKPDLVIHLASLFLSDHEYENVGDLIQSNILLGTQLLEAMVQNNVELFINTGTSWQYYESETYRPVNLYAATKKAFEDIVDYYIDAKNLKVITLNLFDTYGDNDKRKKIMSLLEKIAQSGECLEMSPGNQKIDLVHIDDVVSAYMIALKYLLNGETKYLGSYAVTSGQAISLKVLAERYSKFINKELKIKWGGRPYRPREVMIPWQSGKVLPGWIRQRTELM
jgi:nucleoside-diphosphate-sugar epimerase